MAKSSSELKTHYARNRKAWRAWLQKHHATSPVAKKNGSWTSIDHVENLEIPPDLAKAFNKNKSALKHFNAASRSYRKQVLYRISSAKLPATRAKRIADMVKMMGEGRKLFQAPPKVKSQKSKVKS